MLRTLLSRAAQALLVLWAAFTLSFLLLQALPGDAIMITFEDPALGLSAAQIASIRSFYLIDEPLIVQYLHTALGFLGGDFGYSLQTGAPVIDRLAEGLPATAALAGSAFLLALVLAVGIAFAAGSTRLAWLRNLLTSLPSLFISVPAFWLGIVLIQVFSFQLRLVPVIGGSDLQQLILPVITLAVPVSAPIAQVLLRSIDQVQLQPFIAVALAKGASRSWMLWRHVARNALLPALTMAGLIFGELIAGSVITETVFARNGIGRLAEQAVTSQDTPVMLAIVVLSAVVFVVANLVVDLLYPVLDPRLRRVVRAAPATSSSLVGVPA